MADEQKGKKAMSLKKIFLITLCISIVVSLAYNFGVSIFGDPMTIAKVVESFVIILIGQVIYHFIMYSIQKKKK